MICATNGTDALALLARDKRIEILITDIKCQVLQGTSLLKKRRKRHGLKPILLSGRESDSHGFLMIRKPFFQDDLRRVMTELC